MRNNKTDKKVIQNEQMTKSGVVISGVAHGDGSCYFTGYTPCTRCGGCDTI